MKAEKDRTLAELNVMVVEDEFLLLLDLESILLDAGVGRICGCRTVSEALRCLDEETIAAAILDFRVGRETVTPVARELVKQGIPFLFHTGQKLPEMMAHEWPGAQIIPKPASPKQIVDALCGLAVDARPAAAALRG